MKKKKHFKGRILVPMLFFLSVKFSKYRISLRMKYVCCDTIKGSAIRWVNRRLKRLSAQVFLRLLPCVWDFSVELCRKSSEQKISTFISAAILHQQLLVWRAVHDHNDGSSGPGHGHNKATLLSLPRGATGQNPVLSPRRVLAGSDGSVCHYVDPSGGDPVDCRIQLMHGQILTHSLHKKLVIIISNKW